MPNNYPAFLRRHFDRVGDNYGAPLLKESYPRIPALKMPFSKIAAVVRQQPARLHMSFHHTIYTAGGPIRSSAQMADAHDIAGWLIALATQESPELMEKLQKECEYLLLADAVAARSGCTTHIDHLCTNLEGRRQIYDLARKEQIEWLKTSK